MERARNIEVGKDRITEQEKNDGENTCREEAIHQCKAEIFPAFCCMPHNVEKTEIGHMLKKTGECDHKKGDKTVFIGGDGPCQ